MTGLVACFAAAFVLAAAAEACAAVGPRRPGLRALPARLAVFGLLSAFWLAVWGRPALAAFASVTTVAVMAAISVRKRQLVGEPLVFSDFGLIRLVVRHPDLYYTDFLARPPFLTGAAAFLCAVAAWLWAEPTVIGGWTRAGLLAGAAAVLTSIWLAAARPPLAGLMRRAVPSPALERHVARWGLLATLGVYALRWRGAIEEPPPAAGALGGIGPLGPDLVVVVQLESFLDPTRLPGGAGALPGLDTIRRRALLHGPLRVPSHGAFTMRSEMAVLTGLSPDSLGFRQFDPYLTTRGTVPDTLATRLRARGFATAFLHPFRPGFFGRAGVIPRLGFDRLVFEDDFGAAERFGPYVSDAAMTAAILAEAETLGERRGLIVAVTMENHGPWQPHRLPDEPDPTRQYLLHLANADRAMTTLTGGLGRHPGRVLVCLYGDHPPILPGVPVSAEPTTDYAVLLLGAGVGATEPGEERPLAADELGRLLQALAAERQPAAAPA